MDVGLDEFPLHRGELIRGEETLEEWMEIFFRGKISACESACREGNIAGLVAAVKLCGLCGRALPPWCEAAVQKIIEASYLQGKTGKKGRHARVKTEVQQDRIHFLRWCKVMELRERRGELKKVGYKPTWEAAYENASLALRGTQARGEPGAVKDSYRRVQAAMKAGKGGRYYIP